MISCGVKASRKRRDSIYETVIKSVMLYGCETWRLIERSKTALEATECYLAIYKDFTKREGQKWGSQTDGNRRFDNRWRKRKQLVWYRHVQGMDGMDKFPKQVMEWIFLGKRGKRSRTTWDW